MTGPPRQSFAAFVGRVRGRWGRVCALPLLVVLVALVPLADATPPDPLWIAGMYDAADSDDVVMTATSLESRVEQTLLVISPVSIVARVPSRQVRYSPTPRYATLRLAHLRSRKAPRTR